MKFTTAANRSDCFFSCKCKCTVKSCYSLTPTVILFNSAASLFWLYAFWFLFSQFEDSRSNPAAKHHAVSKRNRTSSASALVSSYSSVTSSSSQVPFSQTITSASSSANSTMRKMHSGLLLESTRASNSHLSSAVQKRSGSLGFEAEKAHPPVCGGTGVASSSGRSDVKKCRKMYGIENRDQWCNQCRWKKACRRFPDPTVIKPGVVGATVGNNELSSSPTGSVESKVLTSGGLTITSTKTASSTSVSVTHRSERIEVPVHQDVIPSTMTATTTNSSNIERVTPESKMPVRTPDISVAKVTVPGAATPSAATTTFLLFPSAPIDPLISHGADEFCSRSAPAVFSAASTTTLVDILDSSKLDPDVTMLSSTETSRPE